jgi:hypothetical protein
LWARSKAFKAAASSRDGCRGGFGTNLGTGFGGGAGFGLTVLTDLAVLAGATFRGFAFESGTAFFGFAAFGRAFCAAFLGFATGLDCFRAGRAVFATAADFFGTALRTGAFSAADFFGFGLGRADLTLTLRLAEDFEDAEDGAGREEFLFAPLITGSLMRSTQIFREWPPVVTARRRELNTRDSINQRRSEVCGYMPIHGRR